jgi:hypothetical protein
MSLFEHFLKGLSLYFEARIWIHIPDPHQREKSVPDPHQIKIRIRIRVRVTSRIRVRIKVMQIHDPCLTPRILWWIQSILMRKKS